MDRFLVNCCRTVKQNKKNRNLFTFLLTKAQQVKGDKQRGSGHSLSSRPFSFPRSFRSFFVFFGRLSSDPDGPGPWVWPDDTAAGPAAVGPNSTGV